MKKETKKKSEKPQLSLNIDGSYTLDKDLDKDIYPIIVKKNEK